MKSLRDIDWAVAYRQSDGDVVKRFYIPALERAISYDRMTGYFSAETLVIAARGIRGLIDNGGKMRLVVGCTLEQPEIEALELAAEWKAGKYDEALKAAVEQKMEKLRFDLPDEKAKDGLGALAFMVASDLLEIKVAVPIDPSSRTPVITQGIYHEKVGIIKDFHGAQLAFSGSNNETAAGWQRNRESFHVYRSWAAGADPERVAVELEAFRKIWNNEDRSIWTLPFPEAQKKKLLEFLPTDDRPAPLPSPILVNDELPVDEESPIEDGLGNEDGPALKLTDSEIKELVWTFIRHAARLKNGIRVGEVTSTVTPWPHQLRSFVRMYQSWPFRMLEASEVGLGKTVIAGLTIRQSWLAEKAKRILLLVPKAVMSQWQAELYEKFNLNVPIYDGQNLTWVPLPGEAPPIKKVSPTEWTKEPIVLASSHLMRRKDRRPQLTQAEPWDLLVLDEAHHARRKGAGTPQEKGPNALLSLMQELASRTDSLLLLTATPMQVHPIEVYDLLSLLGMPKSWDAGTFQDYFAKVAANPDNETLKWLAEKFRVSEQEYGEVSPDDILCLDKNLTPMKARKIHTALHDPSGLSFKMLDSKLREIAIQVLQSRTPVKALMSRHTRNLLRRYYAEGLLSSPIATRKVEDVLVDLSAKEREVYEKVEDYIGSTYNNAAGAEKNAVGFIMTVYRRRLASSFAALKATLNKRLGKVAAFEEEDLSQNELVDEIPSSDDAERLSTEALRLEEADDLKELLKLVSSLGPKDSKVVELVKRLKPLLASYDSAIIFTQYTDTMTYLAEFLALHLQGFPIGTYSGNGGQTRDASGNWNPCNKEDIKLKLKSGQIKILIATDAAGEGLNLQFCGVLVNYDLPWNPMKVEQRIGRIDRIGQKYEKIRILNFGYKGTVEEDVYFNIGHRINLFQGIVGKLQPILSKLPGKLEALSLEKPAVREAAKQQFLAELEDEVREAQERGFDIDELTPDALEIPELPEPGLRPEWIAEAMKIEGVLPSGWKWIPKDPGSFELHVPGRAAIRVATKAEVFDDHPQSMAYFSPGLKLLDQAIHEYGAGDATTESLGSTVRITDAPEVFAFELRINEGETVELASLKDLLVLLKNEYFAPLSHS